MTGSSVSSRALIRAATGVGMPNSSAIASAARQDARAASRSPPAHNDVPQVAAQDDDHPAVGGAAQQIQRVAAVLRGLRVVADGEVRLFERREEVALDGVAELAGDGPTALQRLERFTHPAEAAVQVAEAQDLDAERTVAARIDVGAQTGDVCLKRRACRVRQVVVPEQVEQPVRRHRGVGFEQEHAEQAALAPPPRGHRASAVVGFELAQQPKVHQHLPGPAGRPPGRNAGW